MTQKICDKSVDTYPPTIKLVVGALWLKKYVIKKLIITFFYSILFLIDKKLQICVIELLLMIPV